MPIANFLAMALAFVVAAIGVLGVTAPAVLLEFGRSLQSTGALLVVAALRVAFGAILLWAAPDSRTPRTLRIIGVLVVVAGVATPFLGVERTPSASFVARVLPGATIVFGLLVAYAAMPRGSGA